MDKRDYCFLQNCRSRLPLLVKWVTNTLSGICTKESIGKHQKLESMGYEMHGSSEVLL